MPLTRRKENPIREHCAEPLYQHRGEESDRLQPLLSRSAEEKHPSRSLADGQWEYRTAVDAEALGEQFPRGSVEDGGA